jgi:hypothetical protein
VDACPITVEANNQTKTFKEEINQEFPEEGLNYSYFVFGLLVIALMIYSVKKFLKRGEPLE